MPKDRSPRSDASQGPEPTTQPKEQTLNFRVTDAFKKEFKVYAVAQGISMTALLMEGFQLSKKARR